MRLVSFVASTSQQAMTDLRSKLGEEAIIVTTQSLENGDVRITGAIDDDDVDLVDLLTPVDDPPCADWLTHLCDFHELPRTLTARLVGEMKGIEAGDPRTTLMTWIRSAYCFDDLQAHHKKPILLAGAPGSGKTATVAKLAALQVLANRPVDVLTLDAERAGAVAQLTTLLAPLGVQPKVISDSGQAPSILSACSSDLILIDGPGTNPFRPSDLGHLSTLVDRLDAELLLVMEAGRSPSDAIEISESYVALGARRMVATKLDMTKRLGGLLGAAESGLAFSGVGIGPTIGDGLRPLTADGLVKLLLCRLDRNLIGDLRS